MMNLHPVKSIQRGFTLVEIMVVVAIIGILAAIGLPTLTSYLRTSETTEAVEQFERINKAMTGLQSSRVASAASIAALIDTNGVLAPGATNSMARLLPQIAIGADANWTYTVDVNLADPNDFCITAFTNAGLSATGSIYMSSTRPPATAAFADWENNINRAPYVSGVPFQAGGCCGDAAGTIQAC